MFKKYKVICLKSKSYVLKSHMFKSQSMFKKYKVICIKSMKSYV